MSGSESGKFVLRVSRELHAELRQAAQERGISLNREINRRLQKENMGHFEVLQRLFGADLLGVVLFGSTVRGEQRKNSDIDLLIVLTDRVPIERSLYHLWEEKVAPVLGPRYSPQWVHLPGDLQSLSGLWLEVAMEGEIQFQQSPELRRVLHQIKRMIAGGLFRRKLVYGQPYWIRTKDFEKMEEGERDAEPIVGS